MESLFCNSSCLYVKKKASQMQHIHNSTLDFTPPWPPFLLQSIAVNATTVWAQAPNLASNLIISPLVFLQINLESDFLTTSHSHPSLSHPRQLREAAHLFSPIFYFLSYFLTIASQELFSILQPKQSLKITNGIMPSPLA